MSYKVTLKGEQDEEILADGPGARLYDDWQKGALTERVELRPGRTILSNSIKEIRFIREGENSDYTFSKAELTDFQRDKLAPFLDGNDRLTYLKKLQFLASEGLISYQVVREPVQTTSDAPFAIKEHQIREFRKMWDKIDQWQDMIDRRNFGRRKRDEQLEEVALASIQDGR